jgi:hypothetical protein
MFIFAFSNLRLVLFQNFSRHHHEEPKKFTDNQTEWDLEDPDSVLNTPVHEMDAILDSGSGKPSTPSSSRARANDTDNKDDDCIISEVHDPPPISFAYPVNPVSANPESHVVEDAAPLVSKKPAMAKVSRTKQAPDSGSGAPSTSKRWKTQGTGPPRMRARGIPTSTG